MTNLKLIDHQPRWRVAVIHWLARAVGVMVHIEGIPFGSRRNYRAGVDAGPNTCQHARVIGGANGSILG